MSRPYLAVAAIVKNEAPYIGEWMAFHETVGVEQFFIYDNGSTDGTAEIVRYLGGVSYDWPGECQQLYAYSSALMHHDAQWLAFLDVDEFLFSPSYTPLPTVLRDYERHDAVGACWAVFGTSGFSLRQHRVLPAYLRRARLSNPLHRHIKSIVQPRRIEAHVPADPHHFRCTTVDTLGQPVDGPYAQVPTWDHLRVNHYFSKSIEEAHAKLGRPRADNGELRQEDPCRDELNAEFDDAIVPYVELVEARLER